MEIKAKIYQIIKWEEKEKYFRYTDFGNVEYDLLHLSPIDEGKLKWYELVMPFPFAIGTRKPLKYHNFPFITNIYDKQGKYRDLGLPVLVERPNDFKEGDIIKLDIKISLISQNPNKDEE